MSVSNDIPQQHDIYAPPSNIWVRGLFMLIFAILVRIAAILLAALTVIQFFWMLFTKDRNRAVADFGQSLGKWLARVADFQTGVSDDKPFPWRGLE
ncbi:MAG: DUF4389 domain-containing protein [Rhodobacteraceae bacterium]|nr:DUF4389 domain-containing protein [Paracoccaceae bacterium]